MAYFWLDRMKQDPEDFTPDLDRKVVETSHEALCVTQFSGAMNSGLWTLNEMERPRPYEVKIKPLGQKGVGEDSNDERYPRTITTLAPHLRKIYWSDI